MTFHHLRVIFWTVFSVIIVTVVVTLSALAWAMANPQKAWDLASKYVVPADLSVKWEKMEFHAKRSTWRRWDIVWRTEKLVIDKGSPALHAPIAQANVQFTVRLFESGPWLHADELYIVGTESVTFRPSETKSEDSKLSPFQQLNSYLGYLETAGKWSTSKKVTIYFSDIQLLGAAEPLKMTIRAQKPDEKLPPDAPPRTAYTLTASRADLKFSVTGWLDAEQLHSRKPFLHTEMNLQVPEAKAVASLGGFYDGTNARFEGDAELELKKDKKNFKFAPKFTLSMTESEVNLNVASVIPDIFGQLMNLEQANLSVQLPMDNGFEWSQRPANFKLSSKIALYFIDKDMRPPLEKSCHCKIPEKVAISIDGHFYPEFLLNESPQRREIADTNLKLEGIDNKLFKANLAAAVKIDRQGKEWIVEPRMNSYFEVLSFQGLRQFLDAKNIMVPSPLDVLDGTVKMSARATVSRDQKVMKTPIEIVFELKSPTQRVSMTTLVNLTMANDFKALDVAIEALIRDLTLELPPLDPVLGIPSMARDSRVQLAPEKVKKGPGGFKLQVSYRVRTDGSGNIKLLSKLAKPNVPLTLDINNNASNGANGFVRAEPFAISYLRRVLNIERMQVTLSEDDNGDYPVGGRIRIDQTLYKIFVDIGGTISAPSVQLNSEPFLPRNEIISVLLYNRTSDNLVSADSETVGSFEAALTDRAIGLFGLWAFASTPIRSFSYNSVTKVYTATVDLGDGVTAGIGTNWERAASLEVRKRVSRRWVLTASWSPGEQNEQVGKLVLQWEKRF